MTDRDAFERRIQSEPDDETTRLVFADWLDEHDEPAKAHALRRGVVKQFGVHFHSGGGALTLAEDEVSGVDLPPGRVNYSKGVYTRTHPDGWTITGKVWDDYYTWVNEFEASHPTHGVVWGDFERVVFATSEEAFRHFWEHHEPSAWDYHDI